MTPAIVTPGLAFDEADHRYTLGGLEVPSVTQILRDNGLSGDFSYVAADVLEHARQLGTAVHQATHYADEGDLELASVDAEVRPYVDAWQQFRIDRGFEVLAREQQIADPLYRFAGTIDLVGRARGVRNPVLADVKTGSTVGACYQLAGYAILAEHLIHLAALPRVHSVERWAVELHPGRVVPYTVHAYTNRNDRGVFLAALTLTHERAVLGKHWRSAA